MRSGQTAGLLAADHTDMSITLKDIFLAFHKKLDLKPLQNWSKGSKNLEVER